MDILKLAALALLAALCALTVKKQVPELAVVLALTAGVVILTQAMDALTGVRTLMDTLSDAAGLAPAVLSPVIKTVGIAIITKLSSALCKDAGEGGVAAFLETAGAALALFVALPLVETVFDTLSALL